MVTDGSRLFAELYVAGLFADAGWNVYFPRRDKGFDFIATIETDHGVIVRPVQVKGLYPTAGKRDMPAYGYIGKLSLLHCDMILALVYFPRGVITGNPQHIAYMPRSKISVAATKGYSCRPASIRNGAITTRRTFADYFDDKGLAAARFANWS